MHVPVILTNLIAIGPDANYVFIFYIQVSLDVHILVFFWCVIRSRSVVHVPVIFENLIAVGLDANFQSF